MTSISRMGASQSIRIDSAEEAHKQRFGTFALRRTEKHAVDVISDLLTQLLSKNNIFDLGKILTDDVKCNSLFITLSSTIKSEFSLLRFPDPKNPSSSRMTAYIPEEAYDALVARGERDIPCDQITYFIMRLVTFVAALAASIKINPALANEIFGQVAATMASPSLRQPAKLAEFMTTSSIQKDVIDALLAGGHLKRAKLADGTEDSRPIYYFDNYTSVVIHASKSLVYSPTTERTGLVGIQIQPYAGSATPAAPYVQQAAPYVQQAAPYVQQAAPYVQQAAPYVQQAAPYVQQAAPYVQQAAPYVQQAVPQPIRRQNNTRRNNASSVGSNPMGQMFPKPNRSVGTQLTNATAVMGARGGKTRKQRKEQKQRGGAGQFVVAINQISGCETACRQLDKFVMDVNGNTFDYAATVAYDTRTSTDRPASLLFSDRLKNILDKEVTKYENMDAKDAPSGIREDFGKLHERAAQTMERFSNIKKAIDSAAEGTAPSNYRAFLLASRMDSPSELSTLFCSDKWSGKRTTDLVAYSLLQSLYDDLPGGGPDSQSNAECAEKVSQFIGAKAAKVYTPLGATAPTRFEQIAFLQTPADVLKPFCQKVSQGVRRTKNPQHIALLTNAHKQLRDLYDAHIKKVVELIRGMISFAPSAGYRAEPKIKLNEIFEKSPQGSQVALEAMIKEGRKVLVDHYLATETIYQTTLRKLGQSMAGNYVEAANTKPKNEIAAINAAL